MKIMYDNSNNSNFAGRERTYSLAAISTGKGGRVGLVDREGVGWIEEGDMCVSACVRVCVCGERERGGGYCVLMSVL